MCCPVYRASSIFFCVLLHAFYPHRLACSDAVFALANDSQRHSSEFEKALVASRHTDSNREPHVGDGVYDDDEQRSSSQEIADMSMPLLKSFNAAEHMPETTQSTLAAKKGLMASASVSGRAGIKWYPRLFQSLTLVRKYQKLQKVLASTPKDVRYNKLLLLGLSPLFWKKVIDARTSKDSIVLPKYMQEGTETELERFQEFVRHCEMLLGKGLEDPLMAFEDVCPAITLFSAGEEKELNSLKSEVMYLIKKGRSVEDFVRKDVSPVVYMRALISTEKTADTYPIPPGHVLVQRLGGMLDKNVLTTRYRIEASLDASETQVRAFKQYVKTYLENLRTLLDEAKTTTATG